MIKRSRSETQPFARLKVKVKTEIIRFGQPGTAPLEGRARALAPIELRAGSRRAQMTRAVAWCCSIRAIGGKSSMAALPAP